jgi:hypothetical protein
MPQPAQAVQVEPAGQQPGRIGGQLLELVGDRDQVGGLVVADRGPLGESLLVRSGLGLGPSSPATAAGLIGTTRPSANTVTALS